MQNYIKLAVTYRSFFDERNLFKAEASWDAYGYLKDAVKSKSSSLLIYNNLQKSCEFLNSHESVNFFFSYDSELKIFCNASVVNQLLTSCLDDLPADHVSLLFSPNSPYIENVSRLAEFLRIQEMHNFAKNKKYFARDIPPAYVQTGISMTSLQLLFIAYFASLAVGLLICLVEYVVSNKIANKNRQKLVS